MNQKRHGRSKSGTRDLVLGNSIFLYTQPLIAMPEPLPETGVLTNHSSDFMLRVTADIRRPPSIHASRQT